jgi:hypothetical protein
MLAASCNGSGGSQSATTTPGIVHFVPNSHAFWSDPSNWTTSFGPAYADITLASSNFVPCRGGPFALCYYSGPSSGPEDLSCTMTLLAPGALRGPLNRGSSSLSLPC